MATTEAIKLDLIRQITSLNDVATLSQLEKVLKTSDVENDNILKNLAKPCRKKLDIEVLKKEQNFTQFDRINFDELVKELDIQEPIEQLLAMI